MRPDMHKTLEQPRSRKSIRKSGRPLPDELLPRRKGIGKTIPDHFSGVHTGSIRRWLRSNLGRPWNKVFSELCAVADSRNWSKKRLSFFILEYVERQTFIRDGEVWIRRERWGAGEEIPVRWAGDYWPAFYVHPTTGLLQEAPRIKRDVLMKIRFSTGR